MGKPVSSSFGAFLKERRKAVRPKPLSLTDVGDLLGTSRQFVAGLERDKAGFFPPDLETCLLLADKLQLSDAEKQTFIRLAFERRITRHIDYYAYLFGESRTEAVVTAAPISRPAQFTILFSFKQKQDAMPQDTKALLEDRIRIICQAKQVMVSSMAISALDIEVGLSELREVNIDQFAEELRIFLVRCLLNSDPAYRGHEPNDVFKPVVVSQGMVPVATA